jgi:hypothetical protein
MLSSQTVYLLKPLQLCAALVRYRAPAHICNACSIKHLCTESEGGREIEHNPDSWLESEIARFHRGVSLALPVLGRAAIGRPDDSPRKTDRIAHPKWIFCANYTGWKPTGVRIIFSAALD